MTLALRTLEDVPEATIKRMTDYATAATYMTAGRHDWRIPSIVADDWATKGYCVLSMKGMAMKFGSTRRTMCLAVRRLVAAKIIKEVGRLDDGRAMYVPCLERGDEWRAAFEERMNGRD